MIQISSQSEVFMKALPNKELDQKMKRLAKQERELIAEVLETIREIDVRRMYLSFGYDSLYAYLLKEVGYAQGTAQRHIDSARLLNEIPEVGEMIQSGKINQSHITLLQKYVRQIEAKKIYSKNSSGIVVKTSATQVSIADKKEVLSIIANKDIRESEQEVASFFQIPVQTFEIKKAQSDGSVRITITLSKELNEKINFAQKLLSHSLNSQELVKYLDYITDKVIKQKTQIRVSKKVPLAPSRETALNKVQNVSKIVVQKSKVSAPKIEPINLWFPKSPYYKPK